METEGGGSSGESRKSAEGARSAKLLTESLRQKDRVAKQQIVYAIFS